MKNSIIWISVISIITSFGWAYYQTNGNIAESANLASKVALIFVAVKTYITAKSEKKESNLSDDEFTIKKAGGAEELLKIASKTRYWALGFILFPFVLPLLLIVKSLLFDNPFIIGKVIFAAFIVSSIVGMVSIPLGIYFFWLARKNKNLAEKKIMQNRMPDVS
jgi:hypothetical protein